MDTKFKYAVIRELWDLTGKVGNMAEHIPDIRLDALYQNLSDVLDACEENGLIEYADESEEE